MYTQSNKYFNALENGGKGFAVELGKVMYEANRVDKNHGNKSKQRSYLDVYPYLIL